MLRKLVYSIAIIFALFILFSSLSGCEKEYSYEGGLTTDTTSLLGNDTTFKPSTGFPACDGCINSNPSGFFWNFTYDYSLLCGGVTNAVITPERNGFTFFGPSACSNDTGLIMTVFLDSDSLNRDRNNIRTNHASLEYYDNTTLDDIFVSRRPSILFTIETYRHATGIAKGSFKGNVTLKDGTQKAISAGEFTIQFK
jgi:hypothetical protein